MQLSLYDNLLAVYRDPQLLRDIEDGLQGQMGGSPKALRQHLVGETSLLRTTGVQPWLPGPNDIMREKASTLDVKPGQSSVSTKVPSTLG